MTRPLSQKSVPLKRNETRKAFWEFCQSYCFFAAQMRRPPFYDWAFPSRAAQEKKNGVSEFGDRGGRS